MRLEQVTLRHLRLPLVHHFETSFGRVHHQEVVLVEVEAEGVSGFGECAAGAGPFYSAEDAQTCLHALKDFLVPWAFDVEFRSPGDLAPIARRIRGHHIAKAGLEMALWDWFARTRDVPLSRMYGGTKDAIEAGVSLGIEDTHEQLIERIAAFVERGYRRVKVKVKPGWDLEVLEKVRARFPALPLMADANAAYTLADADTLRTMDIFRLTMIEQPLDHDDLTDHAALAKVVSTPICLDESIKKPADAQKAIALGACRIINIKPARVGGPSNAIEIHDHAQERGVAVWCGGLLESGVGRLHNIAMASLPGFTLPGDISGSDRYWTEDIVDPPVVVRADGTIAVPTGAGLGHEVVRERVERRTVWTERIRRA